MLLTNCNFYVIIGFPSSPEAIQDMLNVLESRPQSESLTSKDSVPERASTESARILAIEDDSAVRRVLKRLFEPEGYGVDLAKDGISGLELLRKRMPSAVV